MKIFAVVGLMLLASFFTGCSSQATKQTYSGELTKKINAKGPIHNQSLAVRCHCIKTKS